MEGNAARRYTVSSSRINKQAIERREGLKTREKERKDVPKERKVVERDMSKKQEMSFDRKTTTKVPESNVIISTNIPTERKVRYTNKSETSNARKHQTEITKIDTKSTREQNQITSRTSFSSSVASESTVATSRILNRKEQSTRIYKEKESSRLNSRYTEIGTSIKDIERQIGRTLDRETRKSLEKQLEALEQAEDEALKIMRHGRVVEDYLGGKHRLGRSVESDTTGLRKLYLRIDDYINDREVIKTKFIKSRFRANHGKVKMKYRGVGHIRSKQKIKITSREYARFMTFNPTFKQRVKTFSGKIQGLRNNLTYRTIKGIILTPTNMLVDKAKGSVKQSVKENDNLGIGLMYNTWENTQKAKAAVHTTARTGRMVKKTIKGATKLGWNSTKGIVRTARATKKLTKDALKGELNLKRRLKKAGKKIGKKSAETIRKITAKVAGAVVKTVASAIAGMGAGFLILVVIAVAASIIMMISGIISGATYEEDANKLYVITKTVTELDAEYEKKTDKESIKSSFKELKEQTEFVTFTDNTSPDCLGRDWDGSTIDEVVDEKTYEPRSDIWAYSDVICTLHTNDNEKWKEAEVKEEIKKMWYDTNKLTITISQKDDPDNPIKQWCDSCEGDDAHQVIIGYEQLYILTYTMSGMPMRYYVQQKLDTFFDEDQTEQYGIYQELGGMLGRSVVSNPLGTRILGLKERHGYHIGGHRDYIVVDSKAGWEVYAPVDGKLTKSGNKLVIETPKKTDSGKEYDERYRVTLTNVNIEVEEGKVKSTDYIGTCIGDELQIKFEIIEGKFFGIFNDFILTDARMFIPRESFRLDALYADGTKKKETDKDDEVVNEEEGMILYGEKYLDYFYYFGGKSEATSFDCSGFVSQIASESGYRNIKEGANGLKNACVSTFTSGEAMGDLIFFYGTYGSYDNSYATHVGIVVDPVNKMMLHCGSPIQYTRYDTSYFSSHFLSFGKLK